MHDKKISVVIPARNEAPTICEIISEAKKVAWEVLVIDGNSSDDTASLAVQAGARLIRDEGKGKGRAVRLGIQEAQGDVIVFIDADGSHDPRDISRLVQPIFDDTADMVIASRSTGGSDELHGTVNKFLRLIGSEIITLIINIRFRQTLTDTQNGFRALRAPAAKSIRLTENITTIEQEMVIKFLKKNYRIVEVSSHEYERKYGKSVIVLRRVWFRYVYSVIKNIF